jgi:hypothetical protein
MKLGRDLRVALALGGPQYHLGAGDQGMWESARASQASQLNALVVGESKRSFRAPGGHSRA